MPNIFTHLMKIGINKVGVSVELVARENILIYIVYIHSEAHKQVHALRRRNIPKSSKKLSKTMFIQLF